VKFCRHLVGIDFGKSARFGKAGTVQPIQNMPHVQSRHPKQSAKFEFPEPFPDDSAMIEPITLL